METNHYRPRYPGFPVEVGGVVDLHAAFLTESRTRGFWLVLRNREFGYADANLGHPALRLEVAFVANATIQGFCSLDTAEALGSKTATPTRESAPP
jgi:hypothetical protein